MLILVFITWGPSALMEGRSQRKYTLYAAALRRAAAVVWQRRHVNDLDNLYPGIVDCADRALTPVSGSLDEGLHLA